MIHITADKRKVPLTHLKINHLQNIVKWLEKRAEKGIVITYFGGNDPSDFHSYTETLTGNEALEHLKYSKYVEELRKKDNNQLKR